jgi:hypothetical protein
MIDLELSWRAAAITAACLGGASVAVRRAARLPRPQATAGNQAAVTRNAGNQAGRNLAGGDQAGGDQAGGDQAGGGTEIEVEHPTGFFTVTLEVDVSGDTFTVTRSALLRTARLLMRGEVFVPSSALSREASL